MKLVNVEDLKVLVAVESNGEIRYGKLVTDLFDDIPTVDAISKEWIRKYTNHRTAKFGDMWIFINCMINDWEKENGKAD